MAPINKTWSDTPPPPLPSYPPTADSDGLTRWLLVSFAGRAGVQIRRRCVVGSGPSCDLCLVDWGISPHHALLSVEAGELYITPLSDAVTLVDGRALQARRRLTADSVVTFGDIDFTVEAQVPQTLSARVPDPTPDGEFEPLPEYVAPLAPRDTTLDTPPTAARRRGVAPIALGIAVPLALFALWFYRADQWPAQLDLRADTAETVPPFSMASATALPAAIAPETAAAPAANTATPRTETASPPVDAAAPEGVVDSTPATLVAEAAPPPAIATMPEAEAASRVDVGPPLIFPAPPPLVDVAQLEAADARVKPPWSDRPPVVVRADAPLLIFPERFPLVDMQALSTADGRVRPPWSDQPPTIADAAADGAAVAMLLFEAGRLYSQGDLVAPAHQNAAALYARVLVLAPKTQIARTRLSNIVGWIALDAGDMLSERRGADARRVLAQLSTAVPKVRRASVDAAPMRRWRVAELLVDADALIQKRRISGPAKPNAVALLREALRIDPHNAVAEQMLSRAFSSVVDAPRH